jgi:lipoprotein-anchoring transpeptidase ErfK/SrfK
MRFGARVSAGVGAVLLLAGCAEATPRAAVSPTTQPVTATVQTMAPKSSTPSATVVKPAAKPAAPNLCAGNKQSQLVLVSVAKQHVWLCTGSRQVYQSPVTTGIPTDDLHTPTGTYQIQSKQTDQTLTVLGGAQYHVRYWIPFDTPLFGFHDSSWQSFPYGSQKYRTDGSHGCVRLPLAAIAWLYRWVAVGATVTIR